MERPVILGSRFVQDTRSLAGVFAQARFRCHNLPLLRERHYHRVPWRSETQSNIDSHSQMRDAATYAVIIALQETITELLIPGNLKMPGLGIQFDHAENLLFAVQLLQTQPPVRLWQNLRDLAHNLVSLSSREMVAKGEHEFVAQKQVHVDPTSANLGQLLHPSRLPFVLGRLDALDDRRILPRLGVRKGCVREQSNCVRIDAAELLDQLVPSPARQARCVVEREGMENVAFVWVQLDGELRGIQATQTSRDGSFPLHRGRRIPESLSPRETVAALKSNGLDGIF
ncbi:hypothetical protein SELMODRAFT_425848 [Selaginella moellendorffii]|uniref:Uncharacterized protein n=1 Tax=Selaginella moellendorffii TaxID=88036 RepID=D8SUH7_SELML|nr:hypothetical protein SELMODRAFT_425848 [Selaginella moellendorffii]